MSYEEGVSFDELKCDKYNKYKIALLLTSFVRNNQQITNMIHEIYIRAIGKSGNKIMIIN